MELRVQILPGLEVTSQTESSIFALITATRQMNKK